MTHHILNLLQRHATVRTGKADTPDVDVPVKGTLPKQTRQHLQRPACSRNLVGQGRASGERTKPGCEG